MARLSPSDIERVAAAVCERLLKHITVAAPCSVCESSGSMDAASLRIAEENDALTRLDQKKRQTRRRKGSAKSEGNEAELSTPAATKSSMFSEPGSALAHARQKQKLKAMRKASAKPNTKPKISGSPPERI